MIFETAIKLLKVEYEHAKELRFVRNPLAFALYHVWKMADGETPTKDEAHAVNAVILPCKMGDVVWGLRRAYGNRYCVRQGAVNQMYFGDDMRLCICVENVCRGEWGKNVFATKEEAEAEIERRKNES